MPRTKLYALVIFALSALILGSFPIKAQPGDSPNIIFIMTDDVGYSDIGVYGAPDISTPNIDRMAAQGVRFTDFYANGPVCSPTRAGLMTGRYQQRYGVESPLSGASTYEGGGLDADGSSLSALLQDQGYATALIGKWHLGYEENEVPNAHGFDYFFGFQSGYVDYYEHTAGRTGEPDLWLNDEPIEREGYLTDLITEETVDFINSHQEEPFFISVQYSAAHWPYQPPDMPSVAINNSAHLQPQDPGTSTREDYIAIMERADQGIGEIMAALETAGLAQNTLVIFTNDNGGEWLSRNTPLFNRKWTVWEGGIRVPAIIKWPGVIPAGRISDQVGITMDFTATMLEVAGVDTRGLQLDGINLLPVLTGEQDTVVRNLFWRTPDQLAVRSGDIKMVMTGAQNTMMFNVRDDVSERYDITNMSQEDANRLQELLDEWEADVDAEAALRNPDPEE